MALVANSQPSSPILFSVLGTGRPLARSVAAGAEREPSSAISRMRSPFAYTNRKVRYSHLSISGASLSSALELASTGRQPANGDGFRRLRPPVNYASGNGAIMPAGVEQQRHDHVYQLSRLNGLR